MRPVTRTVVFSGCALLFAFCALVVGVLLLRATLRVDPDPEPEPVVVPAVEDAGATPERPQDGAVAAADAVLAEVGEVYEETKSELRSAYEESKDALPPEVAAPMEEDLSMIENAIAEIGAALASDPDNESLKRLLVATYGNEMLLLRRALHIAGDEP